MCAVSNKAAFCGSFISCFPGMWLRYFLNDFERVPVDPVFNGITYVTAFNTRLIAIIRSLYFRFFSDSFMITFLYLEIATSINIHAVPSLCRIVMSSSVLRNGSVGLHVLVPS